ncbi:MAG: hypothetical protein HC883_02225 [Bdellovibrionaceae bacterium]|nr:hypothetical protein [Pseudobdellovibrionaceae bacterium]
MLKYIGLFLLVLELGGCDHARIKGDVGECVLDVQSEKTYVITDRMRTKVYAREIGQPANKIDASTSFSIFDSASGRWKTVPCP